MNKSLSRSKMKTVTNQYILNLALADEFFLIGIPFLITTMIYGNWSVALGKTEFNEKISSRRVDLRQHSM